MTTNTPQIIWGQVNADRTSTVGSGGYTVGAKVSTGIYTIVFDPDTFGNIPTVTATVLCPGTPHAPVFYLESVQQGQFEGHIKSSATQDDSDLPFYFIAIGEPD